MTFVNFFALFAIFAVNRFAPTPHCQVVSHDMCELCRCDQGENECCLTAKCAKSAKENAIITAKGEIELFAELMLNTMLNAHGPSLYIHASAPQVSVGKPANSALFILHRFPRVDPWLRASMIGDMFRDSARIIRVHLFY
jgi:hypothetical protein